MKSISKNNYINTLFNSSPKVFIKRNYNDFSDFTTSFSKSHLSLDAAQIAFHSTNIILCNSNSSGFRFEANLGYFMCHSDMIGQQAISAISKSVTWNWSGFSVKSVIENSLILKRNIDPRLIQNWNYFGSKQFVHQKCNTVQELVCATTAPKAFRVDDVILNKSIYPIPFSRINMTSNSYPDYACAVVLQGGLVFRYFADLKVTNLANFEKKIIMLHKSKTVSSNFYFISDIGPNHVFSYNTKMELERSYTDVCIQHIASGDPVAIAMVNQSKQSYSEFLLKGDVDSYNKLPVNTPKFIVLDFIRNIFY
ncbi:MAG: hypothetical protein EOP34_08255 [Rickettsiales bacterium]|nr:MAG: hypothetical protein EOP34_08255 [Rickettsiales bacterium]